MSRPARKPLWHKARAFRRSYFKVCRPVGPGYGYGFAGTSKMVQPSLRAARKRLMDSTVNRAGLNSSAKNR
jgi:hypothetical protein